MKKGPPPLTLHGLKWSIILDILTKVTLWISVFQLNRKIVFDMSSSPTKVFWIWGNNNFVCLCMCKIVIIFYKLGNCIWKLCSTQTWKKTQACMQALLADNLWENCGHFWMNNEVLAALTHQWPQICIIYPQLIYFCLKILNVWKNIETSLNWVVPSSVVWVELS